MTQCLAGCSLLLETGDRHVVFRVEVVIRVCELGLLLV
jgi:hypothetical protein